jgi:DNA-binding transcriptional LysR family regulator
MHLRNVEIFCDVVSRRSFSKAAEAHNVSQSSASQSVHMLEKRLGTQLIDRSKRPFELTDAGEVYFDGCRKLLDSFREIEDRVLQIRNKVEGRVRVAAIYSVGLLQLDSYLKRFEELYPDAALQLEYHHPDEVYARIRSDDADLGLVSFPLDKGEIVGIAWQEQEMVLVVPPAHQFANSNSVCVSDLDGEDYVGFTAELRIRKVVDRRLKQAKASVNIVHEFDNIENIKRAVEIGAGVALLPAPTIRQELESGTLAALELEDGGLTRPLGIIHKRSRPLPIAASKFIQLLQEQPAPLSGASLRPKQDGESIASPDPMSAPDKRELRTTSQARS